MMVSFVEEVLLSTSSTSTSSDRNVAAVHDENPENDSAPAELALIASA